MSQRNFILIFSLTLLYLVTITPFGFLLYAKDLFKAPIQVEIEGGRNEGSTPRTFVLPANPAVALEQERKERIKKDAPWMIGCLVKMNDQGHNFANIEDITSHEVLVETLYFQYNNNLNPSGIIDEKTRELLQC